MRKLHIIVFSYIIFAISTVFSADWTLMVYLDADNNLYSMGLDDVNEMEWCQDSSDVDIIVLFDGNSEGDSVIYEIAHDDDMNNITSPQVDDGGAVIPDNGECDMGDWNTLYNFVDWVIDEYPADKYLLSIWDHGGGIFITGDKPVISPLFKGFCWDDHGSGPIYLWQLDDVMENARDKIGRKFDVVGFDTCIMGQIETAYQLKDYVNIVISSEASEPGDGWDYTAFNTARTNPSISPRALSTNIVEYYLDFYGGSVTQSAQDVSIIESQVVPVLNEFADYLWQYTYYYYDEISQARSDANQWNPPNKDIYDFARYISDNSSLPADLIASADDFCSVWETYIIAGGLHYHPPDEGYGATVWFPESISTDENEDRYMNELIFHETHWDEFLYMFEDPYPPDPVYLRFVSYTVDDSEGGNGNGVPEQDESVDITVKIRNYGTDTAHNVVGELSTDNPYIEVEVGTAGFGDIPHFETAEGTFTIRIEDISSFPIFANMNIHLTTSDTYETDEEFIFTIGYGFADDVEGGEGYWTHRGNNDMWHIDTYRSHSPTHSWKCGGEGSQHYGNMMSCMLESPVLYVNEGIAELNLWTWYHIEAGYDKGYVDLMVEDDDWIRLKTYTGSSGSWRSDNVDLSAYINKPLMIRFFFVSDYSQTYEGWYIDDICLGNTLNVDLEYFRAIPKDRACLLEWQTVEVDPDLSGFNLYRREATSPNSTLKELLKSSSLSTSMGLSDIGYIKVNNELITGYGIYRYLDDGLINNVDYQYLLEAVYSDNSENLASTYGTPGSQNPLSFTVRKNYPNPFSTDTTIVFDLPESSAVNISIYDISGRKVLTALDEFMEAGTHRVKLVAISDEGRMLPSGVYLLRLSAGENYCIKRIVIDR